MNEPSRYTVSMCLACDGAGAVRRINGLWLRWQRERAGYSLRRFAQQIGFSAPYVSDIERGHRGCSPLIESQYAALRAVTEARR